MQKRILVTGATGRIGSEVVKVLLKHGHHVRAMTRDPYSDAANMLYSKGSEIVKADFDDTESLTYAINNMDTVVLITPYLSDSDRDIDRGKRIVNISLNENISHLVYCSVASADTHTGIDFFENKFEVEKYIVETGIPYSIVAPVGVMESITEPYFLKDIARGVFSLPYFKRRKILFISAHDIGLFVNMVINNREKFLRNRFEVASDLLTGEDIAAILSKNLDRNIIYREISLELLAQSAPEQFVKMLGWRINHSHTDNITILRKNYPDIQWHTFKQWVRMKDFKSLLKNYEEKVKNAM